jgi:uracil-DNA glycosylase
MTLVETISRLQQGALEIRPPRGSDLLPAVGGLPGPAFFPEGLGLSSSALHQDNWPTVMVIGHNFGCEQYRTEIQRAGREDDKATWRNLDSLLLQAGSSPAQCFRTNWFIGLLPGSKQTGSFLCKPDHDYEQACRTLLIKQIQEIQPTAIFLLGTEVASRAHSLIPALAPWRDTKRWIDIDRSAIGHSAREVDVPYANLRTNVAALLHPSFGAANQSRRMKNMRISTTEAEIIRTILE